MNFGRWASFHNVDDVEKNICRQTHADEICFLGIRININLIYFWGFPCFWYLKEQPHNEKKYFRTRNTGKSIVGIFSKLSLNVIIGWLVYAWLTFLPFTNFSRKQKLNSRVNSEIVNIKKLYKISLTVGYAQTSSKNFFPGFEWVK